jgi:hypothetical protein
VLAGVLGGMLALTTGQAALANRGKTRRGKYKRGGRDGQGESAAVSDVYGTLPEGVLVGGVWDETIEMCHYDTELGDYRVVPISTVAVPEYLALGDTLYIDCCVDTDCGWRPCLTSTGCISGACAYDATVNAPCDLGDGTQGICRNDAVCVPVSTGAVESVS